MSLAQVLEGRRLGLSPGLRPADEFIVASKRTPPESLAQVADRLSLPPPVSIDPERPLAKLPPRYPVRSLPHPVWEEPEASPERTAQLKAQRILDLMPHILPEFAQSMCLLIRSSDVWLQWLLRPPQGGVKQVTLFKAERKHRSSRTLTARGQAALPVQPTSQELAQLLERFNTQEFTLVWHGVFCYFAVILGANGVEEKRAVSIDYTVTIDAPNRFLLRVAQILYPHFWAKKYEGVGKRRKQRKKVEKAILSVVRDRYNLNIPALPFFELLTQVLGLVPQISIAGIHVTNDFLAELLGEPAAGNVLHDESAKHHALRTLGHSLVVDKEPPAALFAGIVRQP